MNIIVQTLDKLNDIIRDNGLRYLEENPYAVFNELVVSGASDRKTAGAILYVLVSGVMPEIKKDNDAAVLSKLIRENCGFDRPMADWLADIFSELYTGGNDEYWNRKGMDGLDRFLDEDFAVIWEGEVE